MSEAESGAPKVRGVPFQAGHDPRRGAGRPKGSRNQLGEDFLKALQEDFAEHGVAAIKAVRIDKPDQYIKTIASILPKELNVRINELEELRDDELIDQLRLLRTAVDAAFGRTGEAGAGVQAPGGDEKATALPALH